MSSNQPDRAHQKSDLETLEELYRRYSPAVYNLALRMLGDRDEADDLTQEVFLKVHQSIKNFQGRSSFTTWLYRVTRNHCLDALRKRKLTLSTDQMVEGSGWEPADTSLTADPQRQVMSGMTREMVQKALLAISPAYRSLIILKHIEGLSYEEISEIEGCSMNSLNVRLFRAREAFKKAVLSLMTDETELK